MSTFGREFAKDFSWSNIVNMLEKEYDMYAKSLQWQLIENKILENYEIKVTQEDVLSRAKKLIGMQNMKN